MRLTRYDFNWQFDPKLSIDTLHLGYAIKEVVHD